MTRSSVTTQNIIDFLQVVVQVLARDVVMQQQHIANAGSSTTTIVSDPLHHCGVMFVFIYERKKYFSSKADIIQWQVNSTDWRFSASRATDLPLHTMTFDVKGDKARFKQFLALVLLLKPGIAR